MYVHELTQVNKRNSTEPLMAGTVAGYMNCAQKYLVHRTGKAIDLRIPANNTKSGFVMDPFIADPISDRQNWQKHRPKIEHFTWDMFEKLSSSLTAQSKLDQTVRLGVRASTFDWTRLGSFTGSRAGEYAQTLAPKGQYSKVPQNRAAGSFAGRPIAFIQDDWLFIDANNRILPVNDDLLCRRVTPVELHITFPYDKSKNNFTVHKYKRTGNKILCPVDAALSILTRAHILGVPRSQPLGVYRVDDSGTYTFLRSVDVIKVMQATCLEAYPDPQHYMHINVKRIVAHSNRVTAAVALYNVGYPPKSIALRLRWNEESVDHYIRESAKMVGQLTTDAINGALSL